MDALTVLPSDTFIDEIVPSLPITLMDSSPFFTSSNAPFSTITSSTLSPTAPYIFSTVPDTPALIYFVVLLLSLDVIVESRSLIASSTSAMHTASEVLSTVARRVPCSTYVPSVTSTSSISRSAGTSISVELA